MEKIKKTNAKIEKIYRHHDEHFFIIETPEHRVRDLYPWEMGTIGNFARITKEFFRCNGNGVNTPLIEGKGEKKTYYHDCNGKETHSLPLRAGKEFIYPILIDLLNFIQTKTKKRVIITTGHRCPLHNAYADRSAFNQTSKHLIGAEVDFYVEGMEKTPLKVVEWVMQFYKETEAYAGNKEYEQFLRYDKSDTNVSTMPWYNKEIFIKLFKETEGRDLDNQHPYPYLSLQVRYDRDQKEKVIYTWEKAFKGYLRSS